MTGAGARIEEGALDLRRDDHLETAYRRHGPELHRFALRQLRDHGAAGDVVQEVFVRAWRHAERYDAEVASLRVWLFSIARNVVVDHVRRARSRPVDQSPTAPADMPEHGGDGLLGRGGRRAYFSDDLATAWLVEEALTRLAPEHRAAVVETYLRGRPYGEVAVEQGVPVGTVRSRVFYGLKRLRRIMDEMGVQL